MTIPTMIEGPDRRSAGQGVWGWIALGLAGLAVVPWYALGGAGIFSAGWFGSFPSPASAPAIWQIWNGKPWLLLPALPLLGAFAALFVPREQPLHGRLLACSGMLGLALLLAQGFAIDHRGPTLNALQHILSISSAKQSGKRLRSPKPNARRRWTPAPSMAGFDLARRLMGRMDMRA